MSSRQRRPIAAGNWKMNLLRRDATAFCQDLRAALSDEQSAAEVVLFPAATLLSTVAQELAGSAIACGGQDLHPAAGGAHTGDISGPQLADTGCGWVLCGHSERRQDHHEDDALVARKARAATDHGLLPLICLGESQAERAAGSTFEVLQRQLTAALGERPPAFEIAYEPIWAIGTGLRWRRPRSPRRPTLFLRSEPAQASLGSERGRRRPAHPLRRLGQTRQCRRGPAWRKPDIDGFPHRWRQP